MITSFDFKILDFIQTLRTPFLDKVFTFITHLGDEGYVWIAIAVILLFFKKTRKCGIIMAITLIAGLLIGNIALKNIFARPRPFVLDPTKIANVLISPPSSYSFPSGHTLSSIECAVAIWLCNKKWGIPAIILAVLIAFSRNYLYVHYPTDILAGAVLGVAIAYFTHFIYNKFLNGKKIWKIEL